MQNNPATQQILKQHPEVAAYMNDPEVMKSMFDSDVLDQTMSVLDRAKHLPTASTMSGSPGSFPMPGSANPPANQATVPVQTQAQPAQNFTNPFMPFYGSAPAQPVVQPANNNLYNPYMMNPWMYNPYSYPNPNPIPYPGMMPMYSQQFPQNPSPAPVSNVSAQPIIDYKIYYKDQLGELKDMGFDNEEINLQCLKETKGDVHDAVDKIVEKMEAIKK